MIKDETVLTGVRGTSNLSDLYTQYTDYRLELLEERIRVMLKEERRRQSANRPFNISKIRSFLTEQKRFWSLCLESCMRWRTRILCDDVSSFVVSMGY